MLTIAVLCCAGPVREALQASNACGIISVAARQCWLPLFAVCMACQSGKYLCSLAFIVVALQQLLVFKLLVTLQVLWQTRAAVLVKITTKRTLVVIKSFNSSAPALSIPFQQWAFVGWKQSRSSFIEMHRTMCGLIGIARLDKYLLRCSTVN